MSKITPKLIIFVTILVLSIIVFTQESSNSIVSTFEFTPGVMPIVKEANPEYANIKNSLPKPNQGEDVKKWLQSSFRIISKGTGSGSGSLCYYDQKQKIGYIISCGHFWKGIANRGNCNIEVNIVAFYHNNKKLSQPRTYTGKVVFYECQNGIDVSLIAFQPDWIPQIYYPVSKLRQFKKGERLHSVGCDQGLEVADYFVEVIGIGRDMRGGQSIITQYNSPRPGRSGGGLIDQKGYFVGICWGTSKENGSGTGYFIPLNIVRNALEKQGCKFLLDQNLPTIVYNIPIVDANNPNKTYPRGFLLMPNR